MAVHEHVSDLVAGYAMPVDDSDCPISGKKPDAVWCGQRFGGPGAGVDAFRRRESLRIDDIGEHRAPLHATRRGAGYEALRAPVLAPVTCSSSALLRTPPRTASARKYRSDRSRPARGCREHQRDQRRRAEDTAPPGPFRRPRLLASRVA